MSEPQLTDYEWLVSDAAAPWLELATSLDQELQAISRMRTSLSPVRAGLVWDQNTCRRRARHKFSHADRMFFSPLRLEQSTSERLARFKSSLMPAGNVVDLCCGIGGDSLVLAERHRVLAVDRDPICCLLAEANARVCGQVLQVFCGNATAMAVEDHDAWHLDPDRRPHGGRTTQVFAHDPDDQEMDRLLDRNPHALVKLAPAAMIPERWRTRAQRVWLGEQRECKQQVVCFGDLAEQPGVRRAVLVAADGSVTASHSGQPDLVTPLQDVDAFLFEPHAAIRAAGLSGAVAEQCGLGQVATRTRYYTGPTAVHDAGLACFQVVAQMGYDRRKVKAELSRLGAGSLEFKTHRTDLNPVKETKKLRTKGSQPYTLFVYRKLTGLQCIIAQR